MARATLYRRAGNREQLLDQVLWWRARRLLVGQVRASAHLTGTDRLIAVVGGVVRAIGADRPVRMFLESEPETALRVLTGSRSTLHQGMAAAVENLIDLERGAAARSRQPGCPPLAFASSGRRWFPLSRRDRRPCLRHGRAVTVIEALLRGLDLVHHTL